MIENKADFYMWLEKKHFKEVKKKKQPRVEPRPNKLKIFLLEYIVWKLDFLDEEKIKIIFESVLYKREKIIVEEVKILEDDFIRVNIKSVFDPNKKAIIYIVLWQWDFKRFIYFYTFADSEFIEKVMNYLVKNQVYLDFFWFSANLFREYLKNKEIWKLIWATVKQNKNYLSLKWTGDLVNYIKEIIWYPYFKKEKDLYNKIIEKSVFTSIDIISDTVRYKLSKNWKLMIFAANTIFSVIELIDYISNFYLEHLKKVETNNIEINFNDEEKIVSISKWQSIILEAKFKNDEQNFLSDNWLNKIVSLSEKYRLVGYYEKVWDEVYLVKVVDYYVWQDFHMIIFKDKIEMYLQRNNCWNIFHRFVTNIYDDFEVENISYNLESNK